MGNFSGYTVNVDKTMAMDIGGKIPQMVRVGLNGLKMALNILVFKSSYRYKIYMMRITKA